MRERGGQFSVEIPKAGAEMKYPFIVHIFSSILDQLEALYRRTVSSVEVYCFLNLRTKGIN
jgi:hypothetical protein